ncbi:nitrogenase cofactor biosynthesis protein NifB [Desulfuribacillus stibiiarsenatis]
MHLPVAPKCNISCNYCNRKFDCMNESRPGVTSELLDPNEALFKFQVVKEKIPQLSVVGIAGPGDALANWKNTKQTISLIKESIEQQNPLKSSCGEADDDSEIIFCLSTNGLMLPLYAQEIVDLGINHVTITINTLDAEIGAKIYKHIVWNGVVYKGEEASKILINNQLHGLEFLAQQGVLVKVNIVMIKGVNDHHIPEVVKKVKQLGAFMTNIMPLIPAPGSVFEDHPQTSMKEIVQMRKDCELDLQQMHHCKQCRADAIGLLGEDRSIEFRDLCKKKAAEKTAENEIKVAQQEVAAITEAFDSSAESKKDETYKVAVATKSGIIVDLHFGHAEEFAIYQYKNQQFLLLEKRKVSKYCNGEDECKEDKRKQMVNMLRDCDAVLSLRIGHSAEQNLVNHGICSFQHYETIEKSLAYVVENLKKAN